MKLYVKVLITGGMLLGGLRPAGAEGLEPAALNAAGRKAYEKHHRFFTGIVPRFQVETKRQVNAGYQALTRLVFFTGPAVNSEKIRLDPLNTRGTSSP